MNKSQTERRFTERDLSEIVERAMNPLISMEQGARQDLVSLLGYIKTLRQQVTELDSEMRGARLTVMVVCKRSPDFSLRVRDDEVAAINAKDVLHVQDEIDPDTPLATIKVFRYVPHQRIVQ